ncbi:MAG: inositol monophosphatase [Desulfobulbaceae bacterium]|nr:inositol monophosphatase [Desulfobulbaceae bacterium]
MSAQNKSVFIDPSDKKTLDKLLAIAIEAARSGGQILRQRYGKPHDISKKGAVNLVTEADLASERVVTTILRQKTPNFAIMAEEQDDSHGLNQTGTMWVVDPLDGTTNFAHGYPFFAVSIALLQQGHPLVGVVYVPMLNELFTAMVGGGTRLNGESVVTTKTDTLIEALVATGFPYERKAKLPGIMRNLEQVLSHARDVRRGGAAAIDLAYVACGRLDAYYEIQLNPWDTAAGWLLVTEAGGKVTKMNGETYSPFIPEILASNGLIHEALRPLLQ